MFKHFYLFYKSSEFSGFKISFKMSLASCRLFCSFSDSVEIEKDKLTSKEPPKVGMVLQMQTNTGQPMVGTIKEVKERALVIDFNHPLAGKELTFEVKIIEVK